MKKYWFRRGLFNKKSKFGYYPVSKEGWGVIIIAIIWIIIAAVKTGFIVELIILSFNNLGAIFWFFINVGVVIVLFAVIARGRIEKRKKK